MYAGRNDLRFLSMWTVGYPDGTAYVVGMARLQRPRYCMESFDIAFWQEVIRALRYWLCAPVRSCLSGDAKAPTVAFFVDDVADPIEAFTIINHLAKLRFNVHLISHSQEEHERTGHTELRRVKTETVWGNAMYALKDCCCELVATPANLVETSLRFDGFFVAGGQCPYYMMKDPAIRAIMDATPIAAAVCHGPEALIGTKWLHPSDGEVGKFVSYYGAWMSFRDVLHAYERKKPGEICEDANGRLFTGNAPNSTQSMVERACEAILALKSTKSG